jgi:two-component system sensor histidine kinase QseC
MKTYSLRRRLLLWISLPVLLASVLSLMIGFLYSWHEIEEVYDAQMASAAKMLLQIARHEIEEENGEVVTFGRQDYSESHKYENKILYRIWYKNRLFSRSWSSDKFENIEAPEGFSDITIGKKPWRVFVLTDDKTGIKIEIGQRYAIRYELIGQLMTSLVAPALVFIPLTLLIIGLGVSKAIAPTARLSDDVDSRSTDDLSPIVFDTLPKEVAPLVQALNRLFQRIQDSFRREREFTDHAAHELRTPLAAMKTQTQVLIRKAGNSDAFGEGLENLSASIDRAAHLVDQLLSLARLQNQDLPKSKMDLSFCLHETLSIFKSEAARKNIRLESDCAEGVMISGNPDSISILLGNLIDNAVKYTPEGGAVRIFLQKDGLLEIADTGPGLNDTDKERVFGRFVRADKTGQTGSGLGLSIAQWVGDAHGVKIELLDNKPQGLVVRLNFTIA